MLYNLVLQSFTNKLSEINSNSYFVQIYTLYTIEVVTFWLLNCLSKLEHLEPGPARLVTTLDMYFEIGTFGAKNLAVNFGTKTAF